MKLKQIIILIFTLFSISLCCTIIQQDTHSLIFPKQLFSLATFYNNAINSYYISLESSIKSIYSVYLNTQHFASENSLYLQRIAFLEQRIFELEREVFQLKKDEMLSKLELSNLKSNQGFYKGLGNISNIIYVLYNIYNLYKKPTLIVTSGFSEDDRNTITEIYRMLISSRNTTQPFLSTPINGTGLGSFGH